MTLGTARLFGLLGTALVTLTLVSGMAPANAAERGGAGPGAPGSLTGYGFDACSAPAQAVMDAWWLESQYSAVGIYIGGSNRLCDQPELTPAWVQAQRQRGWHLLPAFVGPQASCSGYADKMSSDLATAEQQGRAQAGAAVAAAQSLGIGQGSTLYYDLEDYDIGPDDCRQAALSFISGWAQALDAAGYDSGVYSNIAAAITSLDYAEFKLHPNNPYTMPDDIWFAWANGQADTVTDDFWVKTDLWNDHARIHQYDVDVVESHGGYSLTIDRNWLDVGRGSVAAPAKDLCKGVAVDDLRRYPSLAAGAHGPAVSAAQCLLRRQGFIKRQPTGRYDKPTSTAVKKAQRKLDLRMTGRVNRTTWAALLARGSQPILKVGATGDDVRRLQRSLGAALGKRTKVDGVFTKKTAQAVARYQSKAGLPATGVVTPPVWDALLGS